jgi:intracellular multiplication protein IcmJ
MGLQQQKITATEPIIGVKRGMWRQDDEHAHLADAQFSNVKQKIRKDFSGCCAHCGHESLFNEIHHRDNDHHNNDVSNLALLCARCHQVYHIGITALRHSGFLAIVPELKQTHINQICTAFFAIQQAIKRHLATNTDGDNTFIDRKKGGNDKSGNDRDTENIFLELMHDNAAAALTALDIRGHNELEKAFGAGSNITGIAAFLSECEEDIYNNRDKLLAHLRVPPTLAAYKTAEMDKLANAIELHRSVKVKRQEWLKLFDQIISADVVSGRAFSESEA